MISRYVCMQCEHVFPHEIAYVIESVGFRIYECPECGSRLTKPFNAKKKVEVDHDTRGTRETNRG